MTNYNKFFAYAAKEHYMFMETIHHLSGLSGIDGNLLMHAAIGASQKSLNTRRQIVENWSDFFRQYNTLPPTARELLEIGRGNCDTT